LDKFKEVIMPKSTRIAVIDRGLCNPRLTGYTCTKVCPINRMGEECITVAEDTKPNIDESICIGCGICVKKCDRHAITVVNLPEALKEMPIHRYGQNMFTLFGLPLPKANAVVGLIGPNGVGKSTVMNVLSGNLKPNTGIFGSVPWKEIIARFKGTELQDYLLRLSEGRIKAAYKPQHVDLIPKHYSGRVLDVLKKSGQAGDIKEMAKRLNCDEILDKEIKSLSGGELQSFAIMGTLLRKADFFFFDEPSSYLDVYQRLLAAREIRKLSETAVVLVIEHDLAIADYLADYVHILYGSPGAFGIVSKPYGVRVGINTYLEGYIKEENMRFRDEAVSFSQTAKAFKKSRLFLKFSGFEKAFKSFSLVTEPGDIYKGEVIGVLGPNAIGKTTFITMLTGDLKPDTGEPLQKLKLSYKPQRLVISPDEENMMVGDYVTEKAGHGATTKTENKHMLNFLGVEKLLEREVGSLSGGELQSVMISCALLRQHDLLLLDEPSAFLDVEQRLRVAKVLRNHSENSETPVFIVDHDLQFIDAIADRIMVFSGQRGVKGRAAAPCSLRDGMNKFLKELNVTFRRDPQTGRPRANKPNSQKDREQREEGEYYYG
jgi:ATP-binding cassette subfamily E protein 1